MTLATRTALALWLTLGLCVAAAAQTPTPPPPTPTPPPPPPLTKAERIADRAVSLLVSWKLKAAENLLAANEQELGQTPEYRTALGYLRATAGKWDQATQLLRGAATAKPADPHAQYLLGETMGWRQKPADADAAWKAARSKALALIAAGPVNARTHYCLGAARVRLKELNLARTALEEARAGGFDPALVDYQLGLSYTLEERWQDAIGWFDKVVARDPKFAHAFFYRGLAQGKLDHKDKMLVDLDAFVKLAPTAPEAGIAKATLAAARP
ncbi:MAG TPA: hypothetical protein PKJ99_15395 [Thermoanaerobaculales bacterium]|nr:hypothetical protein [Thermoanaerobaculales bacterium]HPA82048.1 hypothetical protein [Thermoanaerobaculales bacterium]HQL30212.1 hypothetical protein [Thermoanaerobaculales bacterium]HQN96181.1 hypothetical protein [Thermoanaerobaculales bacterium]HQP43095.1 hypothetical protein [Thermoanaerobaculales bacterium]